MKNKMKRILIVMFVFTIVLTCTGCSRKGTCDECGQKAKLNKYVLQGDFGNAGDKGKVKHLCDDCNGLYKLFGY